MYYISKKIFFIEIFKIINKSITIILSNIVQDLIIFFIFLLFYIFINFNYLSYIYNI